MEFSSGLQLVDLSVISSCKLDGHELCFVLRPTAFRDMALSGFIQVMENCERLGI